MLTIRSLQKAIILILGIAIFGFTKKDLLWNVFSIKSKLSDVLPLVMTSWRLPFLPLFMLLLFGFCLNNTTLLSFQIRSNTNTRTKMKTVTNATINLYSLGISTNIRINDSIPTIAEIILLYNSKINFFDNLALI